MEGDLTGKDFGGYLTFESSESERLDQLGLAKDELKLFALGRHCLTAVCKSVKPKRLLLPRFTCSSIKKVASSLGLDIRYYSLSDALMPELGPVEYGDLLVINNYFGLSAHSDTFDVWLKDVAPPNCVIDNTHSMGVRNQFPGRLSFISPRKFLPVTDGGILFDPQGLVPEARMPDKRDTSWHRVEWLFRAIDEGGRNKSYASYTEFRKGLQGLEYMRLSETTRRLLSVFDIKAVIERRNANFWHLHKNLPMHPRFAELTQLGEFSPIGYPAFVKDAREAQQRLSQHRIYSIRYWPELDAEINVNKTERDLLEHLLIIPIDQEPSQTQLAMLKTVIANSHSGSPTKKN